MRTMTRNEAIDALRAKLVQLTDDEHCMCSVASSLHLFCGGFSQWKTDELKKRHEFLVRRRPRMPRGELEDLANRWQLARQFVRGTELACDTQTQEHQICPGWDGFTEEQLAAHVRELLGEDVEIVAPAPTG